MATEFSRATPSERKKYLEQRYFDLKLKRAPFLELWKDVAQYFQPFAGRFDIHNHGEDRDLGFIIQNEAGQDLHILISGMYTGASSPSRAWFTIAPPTPDLENDYEVATWCSQVQRMILKLFETSNTYDALHGIYRELCMFGIAADVLTDNYDTGLEHHLLSAGEYCVAADNTGTVNTLYREFELTVAQAVRQFGYKNLSKQIQTCYDKGRLSEYFTFLQAIEPREDRDYNSKSNKDMPFASYYMEVGSDEKNIISESGFKEFPCIVSRWDILGIDVYGSSPCMTVLPDVKQYQQVCLRAGQLIDQMSRPPMQVPQSARNARISLKAGALNYTQSTANEQMIRPIVSGTGDLNPVLTYIQSLQQSIRKGLYVDQFLMLENAQGDRKTTVEVNALKEEKMLVLGTVVERNNRECLGRLVEIAYKRLLDAGLLPPPPEAIQNMGMEVKFQSVLSQAQKAVDINSVDRMVSAMASMASITPEVLDRLDPDGYVDVYRERLDIDPKFLRSKEQADEIRQQRAQAQQQQQAMEQAQQGSVAMEQMAQAQKLGAEASATQQSLGDIAGGGDLV